MFGGVHELSIDSKGRLVIPAEFRGTLLHRYTPTVVVTLDSRQRLLTYPENEWEKVSQQLLALKVDGSPVLQRYQNLLLHNAELLEWGSASHISLLVNLHRHVDFEKEVTLVSRVNRLELRGREHWEAEMNQTLDINPEELDYQLSQTDLQL